MANYITQIKESLSAESLLTLIHSLPFTVLRDARFAFTSPTCLAEGHPDKSGTYIATYAFQGKELYTGFVYYHHKPGTTGAWSFMQQDAQKANPHTQLYVYTKPEFFYWVGLTQNLSKD